MHVLCLRAFWLIAWIICILYFDCLPGLTFVDLFGFCLIDLPCSVLELLWVYVCSFGFGLVNCLLGLFEFGCLFLVLSVYL